MLGYLGRSVGVRLEVLKSWWLLGQAIRVPWSLRDTVSLMLEQVSHFSWVALAFICLVTTYLPPHLDNSSSQVEAGSVPTVCLPVFL